jgi:transcriptional regulator with XRE-family HTH domain
MATEKRAPAPSESLSLAELLQRARGQLGIDRDALARRIGVARKTLTRWEHDQGAPHAQVREDVALALTEIDGATWRAIVRAMRLPLEVMLAKSPSQAAKAAPAPPPLPPPAAAPIDARATLDDAIRATAEELDVTAKRLRAAFALLLSDVERLALPVAEARALVLGRTSRGGRSRGGG